MRSAPSPAARSPRSHRGRERLGKSSPAPSRRFTNEHDARDIGTWNGVHNSALPKIDVDAHAYDAGADVIFPTCEPADLLPLARAYFLF